MLTRSKYSHLFPKTPPTPPQLLWLLLIVGVESKQQILILFVYLMPFISFFNTREGRATLQTS